MPASSGSEGDNDGVIVIVLNIMGVTLQCPTVEHDKEDRTEDTRDNRPCNSLGSMMRTGAKTLFF